MRLFLTIIFFIYGTISVIAQDNICLNGEWQFLYAEDKETADTFMSEYRADKHISAKTDKITVPSNWAVLGYEEPVYRGFKDGKASEGIYLKIFSVPEDMLADRLLLHFEGVWSSAEVWLNGEEVAYHHGGYTPFAIDVTGKLKKENELLVRVRQVDRGYEFDVYDDWTLGGIYRDVWIEAMPRRRSIEKISYTVSFDPYYKDAVLKVSAMVHDMHKNTLPGNYPSPGEPYSLTFRLSDKYGSTVASRTMEIPAHISTDREICCNMEIQSPLQWTAETPYLYNLAVTLEENGETTHSRDCKVGFREISTDGGIFRINGRAVKLRGVNRHDEHPDVGRATRKEHWLKDIIMMKEANINYIRCAHYTPAKGFIELCDSLGMYLGNEVSLGGAGTLMYDPSMVGGVLLRTYETVERDLNNPSIIYWSVGNEDPLTSQHMAAVRLAKALDPTRPVLLPWRAEDWLPTDIDILAPHYWQVHEYDSLAAVSSRPIITTEYAHAFGEDGFGSLKARWEALTRHPAGAGAAVWMWADQGIRTPVKKDPEKAGLSKDKYLRISDAGWDGIVDSYRNPTRDYHELKAVYAYVYPVIDKVLISTGDNYADIPVYNGYDFRNLNTVRISWKIFSGKKVIAEGTAEAVDAVAHSTGTFRLPVSSIREADAMQPCYVWLTFESADGYEIGTRSVEILTGITDRKPTASNVIKSLKSGNTLILTCGDSKYSFDTGKGLLMSVEKDGKTLVSGLRPAIWHNIDHGDRSAIGKNNIKACPDLDRYSSSAKSWKTEEKDGTVIIKAEVRHDIDEKNGIDAEYTYVLKPDGHLAVKYILSPDVVIPNIPVAGLKMDIEAGADLEWFGLGPYVSHPNRNAAGILGYWNLEKNPEARTLGIRDFRQINCSNGLTISGRGYFECDGRMQSLAVYCNVLGRPEKGRRALDAPLMPTDGESYAGELVIETR